MTKVPPPATPALDLWRYRLEAGVQGQHPEKTSTWVYDELWHAACREARAIENHADGNYWAALFDLWAATDVLAGR